MGAVFLHLLSGRPPTPDGPNLEMVDGLDNCPRSLRAILKQMLNRDPEERFSSGPELLSRFDIVRRLEKLPRQFLVLTRNATEDLVSMGYSPTTDYQDVADVLIEDLGGPEAEETHLHIDERNPKDLILLGDSLRLICTPDELGDALVVKAIQTPYMPNLDSERGRSMAYRALWTPVIQGFRASENAATLKTAVGELTNLMAEVSSHQRVGVVTQEKRISRREFIDSWSVALAKSRRRIQKEAPTLDYSKVNVDGGNLLFTLSQNPPDDLSWTDGTPLAVLLPNNRLAPIGNLVDIRGRTVESCRDLRRSGRDDFDVPSFGQLTTNVMEQLTENRRQQFAIGTFLNDQMVNPNLPAVIVDPTTATTTDLPDLRFFQDWLSADKKLAVRKALASNDLFLIQGPPGTGKTSVISEIVLQILERDPDARILLTSQSNVAVDHALAQISKASGNAVPEMLRIGRSEKISQDGQSWTIEGRTTSWRQSVLNGCLPIIDDLRQQERALRSVLKGNSDGTNSESDAEIDRSATIEEWIAEAKDLQDEVEEYEQEFASLGQDVDNTTKEILQELVNQTRERLTEHLSSLNELLPQPIEIGHLDVSNALTAIIESNSVGPCEPNGGDATETDIENLQELRKILGQWTRVVGLTEDFRDLISQSARVIASTCSISGKLSRGVFDQHVSFDWAIVDEAGRCTVPEVLIPMGIAKRAVLVGDERQLPPMVDEMTAQEAGDTNLDKSLFQILIEQISQPVSEHIVSLETQYRMNDAIGDLVSSVFYEGRLVNGKQSYPRRSAFGWMPAPIVWVSTSARLDRNETRSGSSFLNRAEIEAVLELLAHMEERCRTNRRKPSIGVISGYSAQVDQLIASIDPDDRSRWVNLQIEVATVDSFQGRECDAVIYSTVRSNLERRIGFLRDKRRINVALSRARDQLIIVGDDFMMEHATLGVELNPFASVIDHVRLNGPQCTLVRSDTIKTL